MLICMTMHDMTLQPTFATCPLGLNTIHKKYISDTCAMFITSQGVVGTTIFSPSETQTQN